MLEDSMVRLMDKVGSRYYGKYAGFVSDNADPEHRGRMRLRIPAVLGPKVVSGWALPCAPFGGAKGQGFFFIPEVDAGVWVEFQAGDPEFPIWVGTFWSKPGGATEVPAPADTQSPPTSKIIATKNHTIELADEKGNEAIKITDSANKNVVVMDSKGISVKDQNGNQITLTSDGIDIQDANSNEVAMTKSGIDIKDLNGNEVALTASGTTVNALQIKLGKGASQPMVLGTLLNSLLSPFFVALGAHVHPVTLPGVPTGPSLSIAPAIPVLTGALSTKHMVE